jgi:1,4-alpha-glucan branching enzyme
VLVSDQDLTLDPRRFNVPGEVGGEIWRLRSGLTVADLRDGTGAGAEARRVLADVDALRRTERGRWPAGTPWLLDDGDVASLHAGTHARLADRLGLHPRTAAGVVGCSAAVWAPHATEVCVAGEFDGWSGAHLHRRGDSGVWEGFVPAAMLGDRYKIHVRGADGGWRHKSDPFARAAELPPGNASIITADDPAEAGWHDGVWMSARAGHQAAGQPMSIYELHLGSWRHTADGRSPSYAEVTPWLIDYLRQTGFTHVELMPIMEHPFGGSWGYHVTGYFAPTTRYGTPAEFATMVDDLHRAGIGVILDWVPAHFPDDEHGLADFDGQALFEYADPREGRHPEWGSRVFDWGRPEVRAFLVSSARWWIERFHVDGLRVDAVASMLYRNYAKDDGEWIPNIHGGRENLEAVDFVRQLTSEIHASIPGAIVIAEESTAWPGVTAPTEQGGLGFDLKWDLGWMHDTLEYLGRDSVHRSWHQDELTFRAMYSTSERFALPLSHDEVVHGKSSLVGKMAGDDWQRRANLRLLFGHQFTVPGVPVVFMGGELAMNEEWNHDAALPWHLLDHAPHAGVQAWVGELNALRRTHPALAATSSDPSTFEWLDCDDRENSVICWVRRGGGEDVVVTANFTPTPHQGYRIPFPGPGRWRQVANSDDHRWGGSGYPTPEFFEAEPIPSKNWAHSALVTLPPLALTVLTRA